MAVAIAAPLIPRPSVNIKIGSRTIFKIELKTIIFMEVFAKPMDLSELFRQKPGRPKIPPSIKITI